MDWQLHLHRVGLLRASAPSRSPTAWPPSASTCSSATPACSTSVRPPSWQSPPTAWPSRSRSSSCPFWVGIVVGLLATVILALLLGIPTLRLRADYLAIVTIAAAEIVRLVVRSVKFKDDLRRLRRPPAVRRPVLRAEPVRQNGPGSNFGPFLFNEQELWVDDRRLGAGRDLLARSRYLLVRSPWGRILKAIREDEDAVRSLGKNVYWYKMQSLILGAVMVGFGGFIFGIFFSAVSARQLRDEPHLRRLHDPDPRWCGPGARTDPRCRHLLVPLPVHRPSS